MHQELHQTELRVEITAKNGVFVRIHSKNSFIQKE